MNDWTLPREYVDRGLEPAFETLVGRHLGMVERVDRSRAPEGATL